MVGPQEITPPTICYKRGFRPLQSTKGVFARYNLQSVMAANPTEGAYFKFFSENAKPLGDAQPVRAIIKMNYKVLGKRARLGHKKAGC